MKVILKYAYKIAIVCNISYDMRQLQCCRCNKRKSDRSYGGNHQAIALSSAPVFPALGTSQPTDTPEGGH
jgi:hypothetical protein